MCNYRKYHKEENITPIGDCTYMLPNTIKKGFAQKNINTNNTSAIGQVLKTDMNMLLTWTGNLTVQTSPTYKFPGESYRQ